MACSDVQTIQAGNGSKTQFSFDFPYIFKSEIHVYFWNAVTKEYDEKLTTDSTYPWRITDANPTIVEFTGTAPPSPATPVDPGESAVDNVKIRRITKVDDIRALFNPGSAIRSDDLNKNFEQLRYALQEANCAGIPDDVDDYLKTYYWDNFDSTVYSTESWVSSDAKIATTAALDARFQDEASETILSTETWPDNDTTIATTAAIDNRIDTAITNDIGADSTGITVTNDGDGTITLGLAANSIDLDRIKDVDKITYAEQDAGSPAPADTNIFTASAAARRFDTLVQTGTPSGSDWETGKTWLQNDADKTLSIWNGSNWLGVSSGGTFTNQPKVVYVDASAGDDTNDGHRISTPKRTIKAAVTQINSDATYGDGSIVVVAPGVYQEACPIQIQKRDVAIVGTSVRQCVIHPTAATETSTMFEVNSGTYLKNLTFTGMKASGTRGATGSLWEDSTYGLPPTQGWNVAFYNNAYIYKSPYIQNCTNFSDSEIDNSNLDFYAGSADKGRAGDLDSAPTGGGLLVDGSVPHDDSPLRSIVCDSYTHTGLDAPGIFVTNNGYMQATSSYAFFNHAHITCINGGQANLAASTSDFGRYGLIASGKSTTAIFTSTIDGAVSDGAISFNIDAPTAGSGWHGSATRPAGNMLVTVNSVTYPILSATANGSGWTVTISRPSPSNRSTNLGVNGAISDGAAVSFFLRSMIASSGHTMEYVGSGTDYRALPENGGVPVDANQKVELDNGKIWTATTDQNGKFSVGGNQTDDPFFEVDQQLGFVTIPEGSIAFNLLSDATPQLGGQLDAQSNKIVSLSDPTAAQDAATKAYVDANSGLADGAVTTAKLADDAVTAAKLADTSVTAGVYTSPSITVDAQGRITSAISGSSDKIVEGNTEAEVVDTGSDGHFKVSTEGSERLRVGPAGQVGIGGTNYGTSGQVLTSGGASGAVSWVSPAASGGTVELTASGAIADGNPVKLNADGTVTKFSTSTVSYSVSGELEQQQYELSNPGLCAVPNTNKVIMVYGDNNNSNYGTAVCGTISGSSISWGTPLVFNSSGSSFCRVAVYGGTGHVVVAAWIGSYYQVKTLTLSGTTLTATGYDSTPLPSGSWRCASIFYNSTADELAFFQGLSGGSYGMRVTGGTVASNGSMTWTSHAGTRSDAVSDNYAFGYDAGSDKYVVAYKNTSGIRYAFHAHHSGGGWVDWGSQYQMGGSDPSLATANSNDFVYDTEHSKLFYVKSTGSSGGNRFITWYPITTSGSTPSWGSGTTVNFDEDDASDLFLVTYNTAAQKFNIVFRSGTGAKLSASEVDYNGSSFTATSLVFSHNRKVYFSTQDSFIYAPGANRSIVAYYSYDDTVSPTDYNGSVTLITNAGSENNLESNTYLGISDGAYSDGATATIQLVGTVDDAQSGMTPRAAQYVQTDGTLGATAASPSIFAGTALTATKLLIKATL